MLHVASVLLLQVSGLMSFKKEEAQPLVQQALEAIDDMNNALALTKDVRTDSPMCYCYHFAAGHGSGSTLCDAAPC
jgi:hypothetical protein